MSLDRSSRSRSHDMSHVGNPPARLSLDRRYTGNDISSSLLYSNSDLITVTLLESSRVFSSGCGLPVIIEGSGFNAAKALEVHNILYVIHIKLICFEYKFFCLIIDLFGTVKNRK